MTYRLSHVRNTAFLRRLLPATRRGVDNGFTFNRSACSNGGTCNGHPSLLVTARRSISSDVNATPQYQVYGENAALTIKAIPPEFRHLGSKTVVLDTNQRGRLLFEWTARNSSTGRYAWDMPIRFALSAEEAGLLIAKLPVLETVEFARQTRTGDGQNSTNPVAMGSLQKVFRAYPRPDGSVQMIVDYEVDGEGGKDPPTEKEAKGPLEVALMTGEYQVINSIIQYSIPRLVGWSAMMDHSIQQSFSGGNTPSPHNYGTIRSGDDGVPF